MSEKPAESETQKETAAADKPIGDSDMGNKQAVIESHHCIGSLTITIHEAKGLRSADRITGKSSPKLRVTFSSGEKKTSKTQKTTLNPKWDSARFFSFLSKKPITAKIEVLHFSRLDIEHHLGEITLGVKGDDNESVENKWYKLYKKDSDKEYKTAEVNLSWEYTMVQPDKQPERSSVGSRVNISIIGMDRGTVPGAHVITLHNFSSAEMMNIIKRQHKLPVRTFVQCGNRHGHWKFHHNTIFSQTLLGSIEETIATERKEEQYHVYNYLKLLNDCGYVGYSVVDAALPLIPRFRLGLKSSFLVIQRSKKLAPRRDYICLAVKEVGYYVKSYFHENEKFQLKHGSLELYGVSNEIVDSLSEQTERKWHSKTSSARDATLLWNSRLHKDDILEERVLQVFNVLREKGYAYDSPFRDMHIFSTCFDKKCKKPYILVGPLGGSPLDDFRIIGDIEAKEVKNVCKLIGGKKEKDNVWTVLPTDFEGDLNGRGATSRQSKLLKIIALFTNKGWAPVINTLDYLLLYNSGKESTVVSLSYDEKNAFINVGGDLTSEDAKSIRSKLGPGFIPCKGLDNLWEIQLGHKGEKLKAKSVDYTLSLRMLALTMDTLSSQGLRLKTTYRSNCSYEAGEYLVFVRDEQCKKQKPRSHIFVYTNSRKGRDKSATELVVLMGTEDEKLLEYAKGRIKKTNYSLERVSDGCWVIKLPMQKFTPGILNNDRKRWLFTMDVKDHQVSIFNVLCMLGYSMELMYATLTTPEIYVFSKDAKIKK